MFDLQPAADRVAAVVAGIADDQLHLPTPAGLTVATVVNHVAGLSEAFRQAATKESVGVDAPGPTFDDALPADWRTTTAAALGDLAGAWSAPEAWEGTTRAGPMDMAAEEAAVVTLNELLLHGWDLATATGQPYEPSAAELAISKEMLDATVAQFPDGLDGLFGPPIRDTSSPLAEVVGLSGRDPSWRP